jgi:hypothetical protein
VRPLRCTTARHKSVRGSAVLRTRARGWISGLHGLVWILRGFYAGERSMCRGKRSFYSGKWSDCGHWTQECGHVASSAGSDSLRFTPCPDFQSRKSSKSMTPSPLTRIVCQCVVQHIIGLRGLGEGGGLKRAISFTGSSKISHSRALYHTHTGAYFAFLITVTGSHYHEPQPEEAWGGQHLGKPRQLPGCPWLCPSRAAGSRPKRDA